MQGLRERGKQRRRDDVLLAARALVVEGGADALTMRALAERADVSVPTIYGLIGGREAVIAAMLERGGEQFADALATPDADPVARVHQAVDVFCAGLAANHEVARELIRTSGAWADAPGAARHRLRAVCAAAFAEAQRGGVIGRSGSPDDLAEHVDALVLGSALQWAGRTGDVAVLAARLHHGVAMLFAAHARPARRDDLRRACERAARTLREQEITPA